MKNIFLFLVAYTALLQVAFADPTRNTAAALKDGITEGLSTNSGSSASGWSLNQFFGWLKEELYTITFVIAIAAIVYVGIRMVFSMGKPEDFKKAWMHFVYIIIGLFLVYAAIGLVTVISNISRNF